jgi:hypothetical protein
MVSVRRKKGKGEKGEVESNELEEKHHRGPEDTEETGKKPRMNTNEHR